MSTTLLNWLLVSLGTGLVALVFLALRPVLGRRFAAKWQVAVWLVLALRLLFPFRVQLPGGAPVQIPLAAPAVATASQQPEAPTVTAPLAALPNQTEIIYAEATPPQAARLTTVQWLGILWGTGAIGLLAWQLGGYGLYRRRVLRDAAPEQDAEALALLWHEASALGLRREPRLYRSTAGAGPMALGLARPVLVLPDSAYSPQQLALVLRHELQHIRQGHLWGKWLLVLVRAVHWFNPAVYLLARQAGRDMELACDDAVAAGLDVGGRQAYGEAILAAMGGAARPCPAAVGFGGGKRFAKGRLANLFRENSRRGGTTLLAAALLLLVAVGCAVGVQATELTLAERAQAAEVLRRDELTGMDVVKLDGEEWYLVRYTNHIRAIATNEETLGRNYVQVADIGLYGEWPPIGTAEMCFTGVYDGGGYWVTGLKITNMETVQGLFGYVDGGTVRGVRLVNPHVEGQLANPDEVQVVGRLMNGTLQDNTVGYHQPSKNTNWRYMDGPYVSFETAHLLYHEDGSPYIQLGIENMTDYFMYNIRVRIAAFDAEGQALPLYWDGEQAEPGYIGDFTLNMVLEPGQTAAPQIPLHNSWSREGQPPPAYLFEMLTEFDIADNDGGYYHDGPWYGYLEGLVADGITDEQKKATLTVWGTIFSMERAELT